MRAAIWVATAGLTAALGACAGEPKSERKGSTISCSVGRDGGAMSCRGDSAESQALAEMLTSGALSRAAAEAGTRAPAATPAAEAAAAPAPRVMNPNWLERPTAADLDRVYPPAAKAARLGGRVLMACDVAPDGALTNCVVVSETPADQGFGEAALRLAPRFRMSPLSGEGRPVGGGKVRIPITFRAR